MSTFPEILSDCFRDGAQRLGRALTVLKWPNGGRDAPPHELNALINCAYYLGKAEKPFHIYAEATIAKRGRVDLIGTNGDIAIAVEAKAFGRINDGADGVIKDLQRLRGFIPSIEETGGAESPLTWWNQARERWGIVLISSFRGHAIKEAWLADSEAGCRQSMSGYRKKSDRPVEHGGEASGFLALYREAAECQRGAAPIGGNDDDGWLLWAGVPLPV